MTSGGSADKPGMADLALSLAGGEPRPARAVVRKLARHLARILVVVLLGGFLGATLVRVAPGYGVDSEELDSRLSAESLRAARRAAAPQEGLFPFYLHFCERLLHGDLGESRLLHMPVRQLVAERFPETAKSVGLGLALAWTAGLGLATAAVMTAGGVDLLAGLLASVLVCIPAAVLALLFIMVQAPARLAIGLILFPKVFQFARNLLADAAARPHVLAARARGAAGVGVFLRHVLPVAGPQLLALGGISVSMAFAAAIPVEALCDLPGIGQLAWQAAMGRDLALLVDLTMIVTLLTLLANSAADLAGLGRP